jgi:hypothetical protein
VPTKGAFPWGARAGVGLEGGLRLQLVPPFPWPHLSSDGLEVDLTDGAHFNLELKFSINSNDFTRMVPNNLCFVMKEKCSLARIPLCPACCSRKQGRQAGGASWKGGTLCPVHGKVGQVSHNPCA